MTLMKRIVTGAAAAALAAGSFSSTLPAGAMTVALPAKGTLVKGTTFSAVYYYAANGKRYVFPNEKTYKTWYADFSAVQTISDTTLSSIAIGGNATYRPGVRMVKIQSAPRAYVVAKGGVLRWVTDESIATAYYGTGWNTKIDDVPDAFFTNYVEGDQIDVATEYSPATETAVATSIDVDKGLVASAVQPKTVDVTYAASGFSPMNVTVNKGDTVRWTNQTTHDLMLRSNPHPDHTEYPAFTTLDISSGQQGTWTFTEARSFGYHSHLSSGSWGTITVNP